MMGSGVELGCVVLWLYWLAGMGGCRIWAGVYILVWRPPPPPPAQRKLWYFPFCDMPLFSTHSPLFPLFPPLVYVLLFIYIFLLLFFSSFFFSWYCSYCSSTFVLYPAPSPPPSEIASADIFLSIPGVGGRRGAYFPKPLTLELVIVAF